MKSQSTATPQFQEPQNNYKIIEGNLILINKQPDGDSVAFIAKSPMHFEGLYRNYLLKPSAIDSSVQLRFEGIDTPELHYGGTFQPLGVEARDFLLKEILGFKTVKYTKSTVSDKPDTKVEKSNPQTIKAYIATNALEPHGRPIAYLYLGDELKDGVMHAIDEDMLKKSINYYLIESGFAYMLAYTSMPALHRHIFSEAATYARNQKKGVWANDCTLNFVLENESSVEGSQAQLLYPKIFRRCVDYFKALAKDPSIGELTNWLINIKKEENDEVILNNITVVGMASLFYQVNNHISFQADTNQITFIEK